MTAKSRKSSSKGDIKTTVILILMVAVVVEAFLLFKASNKTEPVRTATSLKAVEREKPAPAKPIVIHKVPLATKPAPVAVVHPVPAPRKAVPGSAGRIAIILDDWGYSTRNCAYLEQIKQPLTVAILPNLRHTNDIMTCAQQAGKDMMLHLPMEPYHNNDHYPDNYLITTTMKPAEVSRLLEDTLSKMPRIEGVNNHMGSRATEDRPLMKLIYKHLRRHKLFFVDSMTSPHHSICGEVAAEMGIPFAQRDVFLDNVNVREDIRQQIQELARKARKRGYAIAIGHDRTLTLQVLKEELPRLEEQGFTIVPVKDLVKTK